MGVREKIRTIRLYEKLVRCRGQMLLPGIEAYSERAPAQGTEEPP